MPGNPKPRKPSPRQTRPQLSDLLRQTHVLCAVNSYDYMSGTVTVYQLFGVCSCGEFWIVGLDIGLSAALVAIKQ